MAWAAPGDGRHCPGSGALCVYGRCCRRARGMAILPCCFARPFRLGRFAWPFCLAPLPGPLGWSSGPVLWAGPLGWSSGLVIWPGLFLAQAPACGRRHSCWAWVPLGFIPAAGGALDRNILAIYSEYTMNLQSVARRSRALRAVAPDPAPHAGTSALASELRLGAGVSLVQGLP